MNKHIKDSFDQIHAPKELIEDTKKKMHKVMEEDHVTTHKTYHWKPAVALATVAACAVIMVTGKHFLTTETSEEAPVDIVDITNITEEENSLNGDGTIPVKEFSFEGRKSLSDWHRVLDDIEINFSEQVYLDDTYVIFTFDYPMENKEYQVEMLVERGELYSENDTIILQGTFKAAVYLEGTKICESGLGITSNSQFTQKEAELTLEDKNKDGNLDFLLETSYSQNGESTSCWYTLDEQCNVIVCNME